MFTRFLSFFSFASLSLCFVFGQISGDVFRDFNGNGIRDINEPLVSGVTINAYDVSDALCGTTQTAGTASPNYSLTGCGSGQVRVEFVLPTTAGACVDAGIDFSSLSGGVYGSSVQFVNGNSTGVNFALNNPSDYNTGASNANLVIPVYSSGDPLVGGTSGTANWFTGFPYTSSGTTPTPARTLNGTTIGSVWGVAYSATANRIFTSAFLRRFSGLGTLGSGGIYMLEPTASSFNASPFYDMDANGYRTRAAASAPSYGNGSSFQISGAQDNLITYLGAIDPISNAPEGLGVIGGNGVGGRALPADISATYDPAAFGQVGRVGLGGLDLSDDDKYLFSMNLYDRKLYRLEIDNPQNPSNILSVMSFDLPTISCNNGVLRGFGVKYYRNKVYVGAVCTGENGGTTADLFSYVFVLDNPKGVSPAFLATPILNIPLNYAKGPVSTVIPGPETRRWNQWETSNTHNVVQYTSFPSGVNILCWPSPILSGIEFNERGDMVLAFADRSSFCYGHGGSYKALGAADATLGGATSGGDILIAGIDNCSLGTYSLESSGSFNSNGQVYNSVGADNSQGPGGSEFFQLEVYSGHQETAQGAVCYLQGSGNVVASMMDPAAFGDGGVRHFSTNNGTNPLTYRVHYGGATGGYGKGNGLGDVELITPISPIEVGNRIWNDSNSDGIQNSNEVAFANVSLELYEAGTNLLIGTVTTDVNGNYLFSSATGTNSTGITYGLNILPNTNYYIQIANADWNGTSAAGAGDLSGFYLTQTGIAGNGVLGFSDNDASLVANIPRISFSTGNYGENNHNLDFGFTSTVFPIELLSFEGKIDHKDIVLHWITSSEQNVSHFEILRSFDAVSYESIAKMEARGTSNQLTEYQFFDQNQNAPTLYYQLRAWDLDGTYTLSNVVELVQNPYEFQALLYPNPSSEEVRIAIFNHNQPSQIYISNTFGEIIKEINTSEPDYLLDISTWAEGIYIIRIETRGGNKTIKLVKNSKQ